MPTNGDSPQTSDSFDAKGIFKQAYEAGRKQGTVDAAGYILDHLDDSIFDIIAVLLKAGRD